jgi:hypothetical protein
MIDNRLLAVHGRRRTAWATARRMVASLKQKYHPTNLFHLNQNIRPAA